MKKLLFCVMFSLAGFGAMASVDCRPETWFHLIGGNVATAGLDADLDAVGPLNLHGRDDF